MMHSNNAYDWDISPTNSSVIKEMSIYVAMIIWIFIVSANTGRYETFVLVPISIIPPDRSKFFPITSALINSIIEFKITKNSIAIFVIFFIFAIIQLLVFYILFALLDYF